MSKKKKEMYERRMAQLDEDKGYAKKFQKGFRKSMETKNPLLKAIEDALQGKKKKS